MRDFGLALARPQLAANEPETVPAGGVNRHHGMQEHAENVAFAHLSQAAATLWRGGKFDVACVLDRQDVMSHTARRVWTLQPAINCSSVTRVLLMKRQKRICAAHAPFAIRRTHTLRAQSMPRNSAAPLYRGGCRQICRASNPVQAWANAPHVAPARESLASPPGNPISFQRVNLSHQRCVDTLAEDGGGGGGRRQYELSPISDQEFQRSPLRLSPFPSLPRMTGRRREDQTRSITSAMPWPTPMHMVQSARLPPVRSSWLTAVMISRRARGAQRMAERDGAAVGVDVLGVVRQAELAQHRQAPARRRPR